MPSEVGLEGVPVWDRIIRQTLDAAEKSRGLPLVGAALKELIQQEANRAQEEFPLPPDLSFREFLEQHKTSVWVIPRQGQDFLATRDGGAEGIVQILAPSGLRDDLYAAFTIFGPQARFSYDLSQDIVVSHRSDANIDIPPVTEETEIAERKRFVAEQVSDGGETELLTNALARKNPLSAFAGSLRQVGRMSDWGAFKLAYLLQRIRDWSLQNNISWQQSWLTPLSIEGSGRNDSGTEALNVDWAELSKHLRSLSNEDLKRIQIPLDVVLKLFSAK